MVEGKKRGRKAKNDIQNDIQTENVDVNNTVTVDNTTQETQEKPKPKTRTRRTKTASNNETTMTTTDETNTESNVENTIETKTPAQAPVSRKRGRKPKGGKIIECPNVDDNTNIILPNVIVHFKCKLNDLAKYLSDSDSDQSNIWDKQFGNYTEVSTETQNQPNKRQKKTTETVSRNQRQRQTQFNKQVENEVIPTSINSGKTNELNYTFVNKENDILNPNVEPNNVKELFQNKEQNMSQNTTVNVNINMNSMELNTSTNITEQHSELINPNNPEILMKIHEMEVQFHNNNLNGKRSSCFWDTCAFDTPAFYIPKSMDMNNVRPYGCFCSLNCALSYLQNEEIDASSKFERRQLLFNLYSNVVKDKTFIKPAPDPRYTLDKFYGNLSIQQWRSLLTSDRMLLIVDKPLTPELPELHTETTDRFMSMGCMNTADPAQYGKFKIRKVAPKQSKTAIVAEKFGITTKA